MESIDNNVSRIDDEDLDYQEFHFRLRRNKYFEPNKPFQKKRKVTFSDRFSGKQNRSIY